MRFSLFATLFLGTMMFASEPSWMWSHPRPTGWNISGLCFIDSQNGWACSANPDETGGEILHSTDGGATWTVQSGFNTALNDVFFFDSQNGWACGSNGLVLRTTDGGSSWATQTVCGYDLNAIHFTDAMYGTVVGDGGTILRTPNGGVNWYTQSSGTSLPLQDVFFVDSNTGWVCGINTSILYTESGGAFWQQIPVSGATGQSWKIHFIDGELGWVAFRKGWEASMVFNTVDGGNQWILQADYLPDIRDIKFSDSNYGIASGFNSVLTTTNGGQSWQNQPPPLFPGVTTTTYHACAILGSHAFTGGTYGLLYRFDFPGTWTQISNHLTCYEVTSVSCVNETDVWACTYGGQILGSQNGGYSWTLHTTPSNVDYLLKIVFVDPSNGYACGRGDDTGVIIKTADSGVTWTDVTPPGVYVEAFNAVDFRNADDGLAVGPGSIYYTHNGGALWEQAAVTGQDLYDVTFSGTDSGWIVGQSGVIVKFEFESDSYSVQYSGTGGNLYSVFALDDQTAWAVGWNGTVIQTLNGGAIWNKIAETGDDYLDVWFFDNLNGYLTGLNGGLYYTSNGGITMVPENEQCLSRLRRIFFQNSEYGWGAGWYGAIFAFRDPAMGTESQTEVTPGEPIAFSLSPNPAAGTTIMAYTLNFASAVNIQMYDLAGRRVKTILDGYMPAGENQTQIDVSSLPAGVYLVRLDSAEGETTGRFVVVH